MIMSTDWSMNGEFVHLVAYQNVSGLFLASS